jgi:transposase
MEGSQQTTVGGPQRFEVTVVPSSSINRVIFETYAQSQLAPTLRKGDVVVADNLAAYKSPSAETPRRLDASPDLNPTEMAFSKLKAHLQKRAV